MTFRFRGRYRHKGFIDITPLIDLSFNLILFFMVSYSIGNISAITVHLPKAMQAGKLSRTDMVITINEKNEVFVNDLRVENSSLLDELKKRKPDLKDGTVVIRGDKQTNYDTIVRVMDLLTQAGISKFTLAAIKRE